jgi:hypothetical protein
LALSHYSPDNYSPAFAGSGYQLNFKELPPLYHNPAKRAGDTSKSFSQFKTASNPNSEVGWAPKRGGTGNLPVPRGNLPRGMGEVHR